MATTITSAVHGGSRKRHLLTLLVHASGATISAALVGLVLGATGAGVGAPWQGRAAIVGVTAAALYAARELTGLPVPVPERRAQVPEWWRTFYGPRVAAFLYGLGLGAGFLTRLSHGTFVTVAAAAFLSGDAVVGALLCGPFGLARALSVALAAAIPDDAGRLDRIEAFATTRVPRILNGSVLAGVALAGALGV